MLKGITFRPVKQPGANQDHEPPQSVKLTKHSGLTASARASDTDTTRLVIRKLSSTYVVSIRAQTAVTIGVREQEMPVSSPHTTPTPSSSILRPFPYQHVQSCLFHSSLNKNSDINAQ